MKLKVLIIFAAMMLFSGALHAQWTDKLTLYLPNRVLDLMDTFTLNIGGGPTLHAELYATRACEVGGGVPGYSFLFLKDFNRQYGWAARNGYGVYLPMAVKEDIQQDHASYFVKEYWWHIEGIPPLTGDIYDSREGARDFWGFGGSLGIGIDITVELHPVELCDAVLGFFFVDIRHDDLTFENFR